MINLLPDSFKGQLKQEEQFRLMVILSGSLMIFLVCLFFLLFSANLYLQTEIQSQELLMRSFKKEFSEDDPTAKEMKKFNENFRAISRLHKSEAFVSLVFENLTKNFPGKMYLTSLIYAPRQLVESKEGKIQEQKAKLMLSGYAATREELLLLQENLEKDPFFENIYVPPSNFIARQDISFSISAELNFSSINTKQKP